MEPFLADLIKCSKVPKIIRYFIVVLAVAIIVWVGIICVLNSPMLWGKIFGFALAVAILVAEIYIMLQIHKS